MRTALNGTNTSHSTSVAMQSIAPATTEITWPVLPSRSCTWRHAKSYGYGEEPTIGSRAVCIAGTFAAKLDGAMVRDRAPRVCRRRAQRHLGRVLRKNCRSGGYGVRYNAALLRAVSSAGRAADS